MANDYAYPAGIWYLDTNFWWPRSLVIKKIVYQATTKAHTATFGTYDYADTVRATMSDKDCVITNQYTITSTGNFEAAEVVVGDILWIKTNSATGVYANRGKYLVKTRSSDNAVIVVGDSGTTTPLTNDAAGVYSWVTIAPHVVAMPTVHDTYVEAVQLDFPGGLWLPNLSLYQISSGAVWVYLA